MKMNLNELRVDSYATQMTDTELTNVKGGTSLPCFFVAVIIVESIDGENDSSHDHSNCCSTTTTTCDEGTNTETTTVEWDCSN